MDREKGFKNEMFFSPQIKDYNVPLMRNTEIIQRPADQNTITKRYTEESLKFIKANKSILADIFQTLKNLSGLAAISFEKKKELMENVTSVSANILKIVMNDVFDTKLHSASGVIKQDINEIIHQGLTNIVLYGAVGGCSTYSLIDGLKRKDVSSVLLTTATGLLCLALTRYRKPVFNNIKEGSLVACVELLKGLQKVLPARFRPSNETIKKAEDMNISMRRSGGNKKDYIPGSRKSSFEVSS
jgi:hypothetical protein